MKTSLMRTCLVGTVLCGLTAAVQVAEEPARIQAQAWVEKGLAIGDNSDAEAACYLKAIELDPTYAAAHFNLGYVYQTQGTLAKAVESYRACVKHDPGRADAYLNMETIMSVPGQTQDLHGARAALGHYLELRKEAPNKAEVEADILAIEKKLASLKKAEVKDFCNKKEIETRLSSGFKRGASPYAGPRLPVRIQFAYDSDDILSESEAQLAELAAALKGKRLKDAIVLIEGHADSKGSIAYNDKLSRQRAESVKRYLTSRFGIQESRFRVEGKGELQPIQPNDTPEHMANNRRVEFVNWSALEKTRKDIVEHPRRSASELDQFFK